MKNFIIKITLLVTLITGSLFPLSPAYAAINCSAPASSKEQIQCGTCEANGTAANCDPSGAPTTVSDTIKTVINIMSVFAGAAAVIMLIVGGFRYVTSSGNAEATKSAKNTIIYALVGLVIVAFAQIIVQFVINGVQDCPKGKTVTGQCK